jgi:hypothetical protein
VVPRIGRALAKKYGAAQIVAEGHAHLAISEPGYEKIAAQVIDWIEKIVR